MRSFLTISVLVAVLAARASAEPPGAAYIFPAGGQRGTTIAVRVGGYYLHDRAAWEMVGPGVSADAEVVATERIWFEGPLIKQPASQQKEDYPRDYASRVTLAADAPLGVRHWRAWNAQGVTPALKFVVGDLPEVVEAETDGDVLPVRVTTPVTINGRIFPREDVDAWEFEAAAGQSFTCAVAAAEFGSPLDARLEIRDSAGRIVAESGASLAVDPTVRFAAAEKGVYQVRIFDARFTGSQSHVYRLTVTAEPWIDRLYPLGGKRGTKLAATAFGQGLGDGRLEIDLPDSPAAIVRHSPIVAGKPRNGVLLDLDLLPEVLEPASDPLPNLTTPIVANGRIEQPGDADAWPYVAKKDQKLSISIRAARLGSPLDAVLVIRDADGKELARAEDLPNGSPDAELEFNPPAHGTYTANVSERFASRGGPEFAYRLRLAPPDPDFRLTPAGASLAVDVGKEAGLAVNVERLGGFKEPVKIEVHGLPTSVTVAETVVAAGQSKGEIKFKVAEGAPVQFARFTIIGKAEAGGMTLERRAAVTAPPGELPLDEIRLACTLRTPFKFKGEYAIRFLARGGPIQKTFQIERNGYDGPLEVCLADRQGRHLQGVTGPTITVPAGASEFTYTARLPPWMELGRTSRTNLMLVGEIADASGKKHKVCWTTTEQNEQLIALVSPAPLRLSVEKNVVGLPTSGLRLDAPGQAAELKVRVNIQRDPALRGPVRLDLIVPSHIRGVTASGVTALEEANHAELTLLCAAGSGPFNMPLTIRGTAEHQGEPLVAETLLTLIDAMR